jgi:hypothetical protein
MAGILANSASETMTAGDTSVDNSRSGYVVGERVTLSVTPTGTTYVWGLAKPSGSTSRSDLSDTTSASPVFVPDYSGTWTITCVVDGSTAYVLRITATAVAITSVANAHRFSPTQNNSIPAPSLGLTLFCSSDASDELRVKDPSGAVLTLDAASSRTGSFILVAGAASVSDTSVTSTTTVVANCVTASNQGLLSYTFTAGVGFNVSSADGADASEYRYALIG